MPLTFDYRLIMFLMLCCIVSQGPLRGDEGQTKCDALVRQLDSPRFPHRVSAAQELLLMGTKHSGIMNSEVATALRRGLQHPSLELRVAVQRLIQELEFHYQQRQLELLVNVRFQRVKLISPGGRLLRKSWVTTGGRGSAFHNWYIDMVIHFISALTGTPMV